MNMNSIFSTGVIRKYLFVSSTIAILFRFSRPTDFLPKKIKPYL